MGYVPRRHPNLLIFYGAGVTSDHRPFLVVELMSEGSLRRLLAKRRSTSGSLPRDDASGAHLCEDAFGAAFRWQQRLMVALDIAQGVRHLHSMQYIHRDLKSDNCLVGHDMRVKVCPTWFYRVSVIE